jgi:hypothetical protein
VYDKGTVRTYVAYNPDATVRKVTFTDGTTLTLQPHTMGSTTGIVSVLNGRTDIAGIMRTMVQKTVVGTAGLHNATKSLTNFSVYSLNGKCVWKSASGAALPANLVRNGTFVVRGYQTIIK